VLLQDTTIDLSNPLAVAAAAEHRQTLAAQASGADDDDDDGDDGDVSTHGAGGSGDAKDGAGESTHTGSSEAQPPDSLNTSGDAVEARVLEELIDGLDDDLPEVEEVNLYLNHLFK